MNISNFPFLHSIKETPCILPAGKQKKNRKNVIHHTDIKTNIIQKSIKDNTNMKMLRKKIAFRKDTSIIRREKKL